MQLVSTELLVEAPVLRPGAEHVGDAAAREHAHERLGARRVQLRPDVLDERRVGRQREQVRQVGAERVADGHRLVAAADAHVHVRGPGVVAPGDVLEAVLDQPVVRRVDDLLVLPAREGMRAGGAEGVALGVGVGEQLGAVEQELLRRLPEVQRPRRAHLDLRGEQLAGDALTKTRRRRVAQRLEGAGQRQRLAVEDLELLLQAEVEVVRVLESGLDLFEICVVVGSHREHSTEYPRG